MNHVFSDMPNTRSSRGAVNTRSRTGTVMGPPQRYDEDPDATDDGVPGNPPSAARRGAVSQRASRGRGRGGRGGSARGSEDPQVDKQVIWRSVTSHPLFS